MTDQDVEVNAAPFDEDDESSNNWVKKGGKARHSRVAALVMGLLVLVGVVGGLVFGLKDRELKRSSNTAPSTTISSSALAVHDDPSDCWLLIHGDVYDLTQYANEHPGGPEWITDWCGKNATNAYAIEHPVALLQTIPDTILGQFVETTNAPTASPVATEAPVASTTGTTSSPVAATQPMQPTMAPSDKTCWETSYSMADVALHNVEEDCWQVLYGTIYDFTDYVDIHPGGARRIFQECGTEATAIYETAKKHDEALLVKEGMSIYEVATLSAASGRQAVVCAEEQDPEVTPDPPTAAPVAATSAPVAQAQATPAPVAATVTTSAPSDKTCWETSYSMADVALHNVEEDCWQVLYGTIYDFTDYVDIHPGGARRIFQECGTEATAIYETAKKHDQALLVKEGMSIYEVAPLSASSTRQAVPCADQGPEVTPAPVAQPTAAPVAVTSAPVAQVQATPAPVEATSSPVAQPTSSPVAQPTPAPVPAAIPPGGDPDCLAQAITQQEVAQHNVEEDCWQVLYNTVYDFTDYVNIHPGGARRIFQECGTEATAIYETAKKHDQALLVKEGMSIYEVGTFEAACQPCIVPGFDLEEVALHDTQDDCWYVLYDKVYDLTLYIDEHPGGAAQIFDECGTDATDAFVVVRKHDEALLVKEGMSAYEIGVLGADQPCE